MQLGRRAAWLMEGRYDRVLADYAFPMPVFLGDSRVIVGSVEEARAMLCLQREGYLARGVHSLHPQVTAVDLPRGGRFRVWVDWEERRASGEIAGQSSALYYCRQTSGSPLVEMVDYTRQSMPELQPHFAALALSA
jgi:hypothetical protein